MGVIRECGGKMHMSESKFFWKCILVYHLAPHTSLRLLESWDQAQTDFFESFKNYDEAGSAQRIQVLKYAELYFIFMVVGSIT